LNTIDIEKLIHRVISGKQLIVYDNITYELRNPSVDLKIKSNLIYDEYYDDNLYSDVFIDDNDLEILLLDMGVLYPEYDKDLKFIEKKIENLKVSIYTSFFDKTKLKKFEQELASNRKRYNQIYSLRHSLDFLNLENHCHTIKNEYIICNTLYYYDTNNLVFNNQNSINYTLFNNLVQHITANILDISIIKELARSDYWRNYYTITKNSLFPYSAIEFSEEQRALLSISLMYDRIYEHPECPDGDVIAHDDALEGWMIVQQRENKEKKKQKGVMDGIGSTKIRNSSEIFLMANSEQQKEDILALNTMDSKRRMESKFAAVSELKNVRDGQLPDVKQDLIKQLHEQSKK